MAANTSAIYSKIADVQWIDTVTDKNITTDLTSGTIYLIFTADATNGGRVDKISIMPLGTNIATVMRFWVNNGATTATLANNSQFKDVTLPATTVSQVAELGATEIPMDLPLPPGYRLYATLGTCSAAGFDVVAYGGKY